MQQEVRRPLLRSIVSHRDESRPPVGTDLSSHIAARGQSLCRICGKTFAAEHNFHTVMNPDHMSGPTSHHVLQQEVRACAASAVRPLLRSILPHRDESRPPVGTDLSSHRYKKNRALKTQRPIYNLKLY